MSFVHGDRFDNVVVYVKNSKEKRFCFKFIIVM